MTEKTPDPPTIDPPTIETVELDASQLELAEAIQRIEKLEQLVSELTQAPPPLPHAVRRPPRAIGKGPFPQ